MLRYFIIFDLYPSIDSFNLPNADLIVSSILSNQGSFLIRTAGF